MICFINGQTKSSNQNTYPQKKTYPQSTKTQTPAKKPNVSTQKKKPIYPTKPKYPATAETKKTTTTESAPVQSNIPTEKYDTIVLLGGKKIICNVRKVNVSSVSFVKPGSVIQQEILRKDIEKILYKNGKLEVFNKPVFSVIDELQWEAVMITENENDVRGLYKRGVIRSTASSGSRSPKAAKQSAMIRMQKKAANMGAIVVLLVSSEMKGGYGEIPGWELVGIAYGDTPPNDTAAVNKAIRELVQQKRANQ